MKNLTIKVSLLLLIAIAAIGCYQQIDFDLDSQEFLVVDALLRDDLSQNEIRINMLETREEDGIFEPVDEARVQIIDENETSYLLQGGENGIYLLNSTLDVTKYYRLRIEISNESYSSNFTAFGNETAQLESIRISTSQEVFFTDLGTRETVDLIDFYVKISNTPDYFAIVDYEGLYKG